MATDSTALADRLLDAQVAFILEELSGPRLAEVVARDVDALAEALETLTVGDLVDRDQVAATAKGLLASVATAPVVDALAEALVPALYGLGASDDHQLGEVVARVHVEALVDKVLSMSALHEEANRRLSGSPAVARVALHFVTTLVGEVVQENRRRVEKLPGAKSLLSVGDFAASKARSMTPKQVEQLVGGAAGKGTELALARVTRAVRDTLDQGPVRRAAMEVWDLHAEDAIGGLRGYATEADTREVVAIAREVLVAVPDTPWFQAVVDEVVDVFLDRYGTSTVGELLADLGLERSDVVAEVQRHAPTIVGTLAANGQLEALVRRQLEPFFTSDAVRDLLESGA